METSTQQVPLVAPEMKFCTDCGEKILRKAEICPKCGCQQIPAPQRPVQQSTNFAMGVGLSRLGLIAAHDYWCHA
jgi:hypothetical protein